MSVIRDICAIIGVSVILMLLLATLLGSFGWNFRLCYGPKDKSLLITEVEK